MRVGTRVRRAAKQLASCTSETLEQRRLLSVSANEYATLRATYSNFGLPEDIAQINIIEISPEQLSVANLKSAIAAAAATTSPDLVVVRTTDTQNTITYAASTDELRIVIPASNGAISIVGFGPQPLTLDAAQRCRVMYGGSSNSNTTVNLGGMLLKRGYAPGYGGGITQGSGTLRLTNVTIDHSWADQYGGGLMVTYVESELTNVTITGNTALDGGGAYIYGGKSTMANVVISGNTADSYGGGIYAATNLKMVDSRITGNTSMYIRGGGISTQNGWVDLTNVTISGNKAWSGGGGIDHYLGRTSLTNVVISGNTAYTASGMRQEGGDTTLTNVTISGNSAQSSTSAGAGFYQVSGTATLANTIVARNTAASAPDVYSTGDTLSGVNNLIGDGTGQTSFVHGISGNLVGAPSSLVDPRFVGMSGTDWTQWNLRLQGGSPAVNTGSNGSIPAEITTDITGASRINSGIVDIGAYEFDPPPTVSSVSINDGTVQRSMVKKLSVTFSEPMTLATGALTVKLSSGQVIPNTTITAANSSGDKRTYTLTFSGSAVVGGSLPDGIYDLIVTATGVQDLAGNPLTATYTQRFHRLFGDSDGNRIVNALDYARLKQTFGRSPTDPLFNSAFDWEGNSLINALDLARFRQRYGLTFSY